MTPKFTTIDRIKRNKVGQLLKGLLENTNRRSLLTIWQGYRTLGPGVPDPDHEYPTVLFHNVRPVLAFRATRLTERMGAVVFMGACFTKRIPFIYLGHGHLAMTTNLCSIPSIPTKHRKRLENYLTETC